MQWVPVGAGSSSSSSSSSSKRGRATRPRALYEDRPRSINEETHHEEKQRLNNADRRRSLNDDIHAQYTTSALFSPEELWRHRRLVQSAPASPTRQGCCPTEAQSASSSPHDNMGERACIGAWPHTPSSCDRTPSPCTAPAPHTAYVMAAVPVFAVPPMPMPLPQIAPSHNWVDEVAAMAARLSTLAPTAPTPLNKCVVHRDLATDLDMHGVETLEATASSIRKLRVEAEEFEQQAVSVLDETSRTEAECATIEAEVKALTSQLDSRMAAQLQDHYSAVAALAAATQCEAKSVQTLAAAKSDAQRRATASSEFVAKLRAQLASQVQATEDAHEKVARARDAQELAQDLPRLRAKQKTADARVAQLVKDCQNMQRQVEAAQAESEAALQTGNSSRAEVLQARVLQLEQECRHLQQPSSSNHIDGSSIATTLADELASAQECNQRLLAEVRDARSERDEAHAAVADQEKEIKSVKSRLEYSDLEHADIQSQICDGSRRCIELKDEVETLRAHLANVEQKVKDLEDENQESKRRHLQAKDDYAALKKVLQTIGNGTDVLDGKLQNALTKLEKEKPQTPLSRCLRYSRPREKWSNACRFRPRDRLNGSDAGSESIDADVSTTCGESAIDMDIGQIGF